MAETSCTNLQTMPDIMLVKNIKDDNALANESIEILANRHSGLYVSTVLRTSGTSIPNLKSDLLEDKLFVVFNAAKSYDETRGSSFTTHFANETKWNCLKNKSRKSNIEIPCESDYIDAVLDRQGKHDSITFDDMKLLMAKLMEEIDAITDERAKKIITLRYFSDENKKMSWKKVAKEVQLSIQGAINIHDKYIETIKKNITKKYKEEIT